MAEATLIANNCDISFIIPVYNAEPFLTSCLNSILATDVDKEIIIIDDGSSDNSLEIAEAYAKLHAEIRIIQQAHQGVSSARNQGIKQAKGRYIQFVDADDRIIYTHYYGLIRFCDMSACDILRGLVVEQELDNTIGYQRKPESLNTTYPAASINGAQYFRAMQESCGFTCCWLGFYRTEFLRQHQIYFDERVSISEDNLFMIDCFLMHEVKVLYFPNYIYLYRRNAQSSTLKKDNFAGFQDILTACKIMKQKQQRLAASPDKAEMIEKMINSTYRYAYEKFYLNLNLQLKLAAKALFQEHNVAIPQE
ncbi:glycosyl transferase family 2 [Bibersteinia trehalosi]|uniref:glycosyltransferase n=1 Tax=Bibersteinia trehalosi TaxID=47735 RepID=UPI00104950E3|nr:glycosyltransferase [Bibersteinia trehalosi]TCT17884.1 glycosyl transferase family 2 [Bibersteinia trehalosi]